MQVDELARGINPDRRVKQSPAVVRSIHIQNRLPGPATVFARHIQVTLGDMVADPLHVMHKDTVQINSIIPQFDGGCIVSVVFAGEIQFSRLLCLRIDIMIPSESVSLSYLFVS